KKMRNNTSRHKKKKNAGGRKSAVRVRCTARNRSEPAANPLYDSSCILFDIFIRLFDSVDRVSSSDPLNGRTQQYGGRCATNDWTRGYSIAEVASRFANVLNGVS